MIPNNPYRTLREPFQNRSETHKSGNQPHLHLQHQLHRAPSTQRNATQQHLTTQAPQALAVGDVNLLAHVTVTSLRRKRMR